MAEPIAAYWRDASHANVAVHALEVTLEANGDLSAVFARARMRTKELHIGLDGAFSTANVWVCKIPTPQVRSVANA